MIQISDAKYMQTKVETGRPRTSKNKEKRIMWDSAWIFLNI